jgi:hypothetical protein
VEVNTAPTALLAIAAPSERALLEWIQTKVSRPMLEEISLNDYGEESAEHLAGMQAQLAAHPPLGMLPLCPREVLELERWNDPDHPYMDKPPSGARGHIKRLLACTILLRNGAYVRGAYGLSEEDFFLQTSAASLIRLTQSALALEIPALGLGFMLWLFEVQPHPGLRPFTAFCALALAAAIGFGDASESEIIQACSWVDAEEVRSRNALGKDVDSERWLIGINSYEGLKDRDHDWLFVAEHVFEKPQRTYSAQISETLRGFSHRLTGPVGA